MPTLAETRTSTLPRLIERVVQREVLQLGIAGAQRRQQRLLVGHRGLLATQPDPRGDPGAGEHDASDTARSGGDQPARVRQPAPDDQRGPRLRPYREKHSGHGNKEHTRGDPIRG